MDLGGQQAVVNGQMGMHGVVQQPVVPVQQRPVTPQQIAVAQPSETMRSAQSVEVLQARTILPPVDSQNSQVQQEVAFDRSSIQEAFTNAIKKCKTALKKLMESHVKKHAKHPSQTYHAVKKMLNGSGSFMNKYQHLKVQLHQLEDSKNDDLNSQKLGKRSFTGFKPAVTMLRDVRKEIS